MKFDTRKVVLAVSVLAAVGLAGLIYWWDPAPPPPAEGLIHQHATRLPAKHPVEADRAVTLPPGKGAHEPASIPAASMAPPPAEDWLPRTLKAEEKIRRAAADADLMKSEVLQRGSMANAQTLQKEVINRHYADVDTQLNDILARAVADPNYDLVERDASTFTEGGKGAPQLNQESIDDWVAASPNSSWAHLSAAWRLQDQAWEARGGNFAYKVSEDQWKAMRRYASQARAEIKKSLKLNPKSAMAWLLLIEIDQLDDGPSASDYLAASKQRPASILIPDIYQGLLEPRWGGSYEQMQAAAHSLLSRLKMNPRFWSVGGFADADQGYGNMDDSCDRCTPHDWTVMLKNYNTALAYGDHTEWLADAGLAAMHLHHYALAYRYYERANAYMPEERGWFEEMRVIRMLCDPHFPRQELEAYEQDAITYGFISNIDHPRSAGDCTYHLAELPWGDEPIPVAASVEPYILDPDKNPPVRVGPAFSIFSDKPASLKSQDGRYAVAQAVAGSPDPNGNRYKLQLQDSVTGVSKDFYPYATYVTVSWTVDSKRLYVSGSGKDSGLNTCSVFNVDDLSRPFVVFKELAARVKDIQSMIGDKNLRVLLQCSSWVTNDHLLLMVIAWPAANKSPALTKYYEYSVSKDSFTEWDPSSH